MKIPRKLIDFFYAMTKIKKPDMYESAARKLDVELAAIKAVAEVESRGSGFITFEGSKVPVILFERHVFHRRSNGKWTLSHPDISNRKAGGYGKAGANQHLRLQKAVALDKDAALESASWGRFQVMGFHWKTLGYKRLQDFINDMYTEEGQLDAFVRYILMFNLAPALRAKDWAKFAKGYNGANYKINKYDEKMAREYTKFKKQELG